MMCAASANAAACVVQRERITACWTHKRTSTLSFRRLRDFPAAFFMQRLWYGNKYAQLPMGRVLASHAFFVTTKNICHATSCQHHPPFPHHAPPRRVVPAPTPAPVPARSPRAERATAPVPVLDVPRSRTVKPLFPHTILPATPLARSYLCNRVNSTIMSPCPMRVSM